MPATPIDPATLPDDAPGVRSDASIPTSAVLAKLKAGGIQIIYGNLCMWAEERALNQARQYAGSLLPEERHRAMRLIDVDLRKYKPKILRGTASKKKMDSYYRNLLLWTALNEQSAS